MDGHHRQHRGADNTIGLFEGRQINPATKAKSSRSQAHESAMLEFYCQAEDSCRRQSVNEAWARTLGFFGKHTGGR
jgi:hypothetical protein